MQLVINASPESALCSSSWSGYEAGYGEIRYTTPTSESDIVEITLPDTLIGAGFESAHLSYNHGTGGGTHTVRYDGTSVNVTDANLLQRLKNGERNFRLKFTYRATGGTGGEGVHYAYSNWRNIRLTIEYAPAGGIIGELTAGTHGISYYTTVSSLGPGEEAVMSIITDSGITSATLYLGDLVRESDVIDGRADFELALTAAEIAAMTSRTENALLQIAVADSGGTYLSQTVTSGFVLVKQRNNPSVSVSFADAMGYRTTFGNFVSGQSDISAEITVSLDTAADPSISITERSFVLGDVSYPVASDDVPIGVLTGSGLFTWTVTVTDSHGNTGTATGTITLLGYTAPSVSTFELQRCSVTYGPGGEPILAPDDGSPTLWLTLTGAVASVANANAWKADLTLTGNGETITIDNLLTGTDGETISIYRDVELLEDVELPVTAGYSATLTVTDEFGSYVFTCRDIPKGGAILNIEATGVSIGKRSEGTRQDPLFEVAYKARFLNDVYDKNGNPLGVNVYSTTPKVCGTWIDGRTIYRVVLTGVTMSAGSSYIDLGFAVDVPIALYGMIKSGVQWHPINSYYTGQFHAYARYNTASQLVLHGGGNYTNGFIVLEYIPAAD